MEELPLTSTAHAVSRLRWTLDMGFPTCSYFVARDLGGGSAFPRRDIHTASGLLIRCLGEGIIKFGEWWSGSDGGWSSWQPATAGHLTLKIAMQVFTGCCRVALHKRREEVQRMAECETTVTQLALRTGTGTST
jgi:hypothetical protein